jgi:hypothetical protein
MFFRPALLAVLLVSGTAAAAAAQSGEFPFRRFGSRTWVMPRFEMRPYRYSVRDNQRIRADVERARVRLMERSRELADRVRLRGFDSRGDLALRLRDRGLAMRDDARNRRMELRFRDMDRVRELRDRMDHFRLERPMIMRRHARTI